MVSRGDWRQPPDGFEDIIVAAAGKAGDQNGTIALADAERGGAIFMRWTAAHRDIAVPATAQAIHEALRF
ncbi:hypothetical protein [Sphingorhabdus sp.]|uniref:hypothetical protein n=1 Tax=Sphingorhabdus sp. TaxID=1902408 RepID=UPI003CC63E69